MMTEDETLQGTRALVKAKYARRASQALEPSLACGTDPACDPVSTGIYTADDGQRVPAEALRASLGSGNPVAAANLKPGEVVLDLGSGGGIDVLLAAEQVGPNGFVYGLDMTDEMLALAEQNRARQGIRQARFIKSYIEEIPLADSSVDVVISNCVINLSPDKGRVLHEAFRVLKPGGRLVVSDVMVLGELANPARREMEERIGCVAGALEDREYRRLLAEAGCQDVQIGVTRVHSLPPSGACQETNTEACALSTGGSVVSALVRARKG